MNDIDDFTSGGTSLPAIKFAEVGDTVSGQILDGRKLEDRTPDGTIKTWSNGDPMHVFVFDLDTDGDGSADHSLWVRGNLVKVLRQALADADLRPSDCPKITVKFTEYGEPTRKGYSAPKLFKAKAEKMAKPTVANLDDF